MGFLSTFFGDPNAREIAKIEPIIADINARESWAQALSDDELRAQTEVFRGRLASGATLEELLPEAFAVAREASHRILGQRQYDVQLIGGVALHRGTIAEMRTGEGKTLTAVASVYLNALTKKGVHVITVNDYLAKRDAVWMGQVYHALGLTVGCIQHEGGFRYDPAHEVEQKNEEPDTTGSFKVVREFLKPVSRKDAYDADITYGTNNEFGFDYLRDNMVSRAEEMVQRELHYAIVDEVDSILIDEARTPLIISAPAEEAADLYYRFAELVTRLSEKDDYVIDEKMKVVTLTEIGISKIEQALGIENLYVHGGTRMVHHMESALRAHTLYKRDRDYVVKDGEVVIVDEFTGRMMIGRRYSEGLHQAIEAKERVAIQRESRTMATITFQNYFRLYEKLAGMTGTALTEAEEFHKIYKLEVTQIPTNKTAQRTDLPDRVYKSVEAKFHAVVEEIRERHEKGQPLLVGTVSIEKNELLSELLRDAGIPFQLLNAKNHEKEGEIIAQAGQKGAVTVATNMAGRGVDILLGGNPPDAKLAEEIRALGGLHVIGTERHESRRIDNQLRGRAGRQGDPGSTQFFLSLDDDLMRIFGSEAKKKQLERLGLPEDMPIESGMMSKAIEIAQKKVEGHNFDIRKHLLEYDDVLNKHRTVVYKRRHEVLKMATAQTEDQKPTRTAIREAIDREIEALLGAYVSAEDTSLWDLVSLKNSITAMFPTGSTAGSLVPETVDESGKLDFVQFRTKLSDALMTEADVILADVEKQVAKYGSMTDIEKQILLQSIDVYWIEHLESIDYLRRGIGLQGYGQRDPLVEYKRECFRLFNELLGSIDRYVANAVLKIQVSAERASTHALPATTIMDAGADVGRNDPCPCGSGKKYKKCHGA